MRMDIMLILFFVTFLLVELRYFSGIFFNKVNGQGMSCGRNSSYSFIRFLRNFTGVLVMV